MDAGNVTIVLPGGGGALVVVPQPTLDKLVYTLNFTGSGGQTVTAGASGRDGSVRVSLSPGVWSLWVEARLAGSLFGTGGVDNFTVRSGADNRMSVKMYFSSAAITKFVLTTSPLVEGIPNIETHTVTVVAPAAVTDTMLGSIVPDTLLYSDEATIDPLPSAAQDFTNPVEYTVTAADGTVEIWTVTVIRALTSDTEIAGYLGTAPGGATAAAPVLLPVNMALSSANWEGILTAIGTAGKYVNLDLSACTASSSTATGGLGSSGVFDPYYLNTSAGKGKIVSLVLPTAATGIIAGSTAAFRYFTNLESVAGANVTNIGNYAFFDCDALASIAPADFPVLTSIGRYAFANSNGLSTVSLPEGLTSIANNAFQGCNFLTTVNLPATLSTIDDLAFIQCDALTTFNVAAGNPNFSHSGDHLMLLDAAGTTLVLYPSATGPVTLPSSIAAVGNYAFFRSTGLTSVNLPDVLSIGSGAFTDCSALSTVNIPAAISIGSSAFSLCYSLTTVNIPAATSIGTYAFSYTGTAPLAVALGNSAPALGADIFNAVTQPKTVTVTVPAGATGYDATWQNNFTGGNANINLSVTGEPFSTPGAVAAYLDSVSGGLSAADPVSLVVNMALSSGNWNYLLSAIADANSGSGKYVNLDLSACTTSSSVATGGLGSGGVFNPYHSNTTGKNRIVSLVLPTAAMTIQAGLLSSEAAFRHFSALKSVEGAHVQNIGDYAFQSCAALASIDFPAAGNIGHDAFTYCTSLTTANLPVAGVIGHNAFSYTGTAPLTITLRSNTAPSMLGTDLFYFVTQPKTVTVTVPTGATGYDATWQNTFTGGNANITLTVVYE
jgi:hypothetical protein